MEEKTVTATIAGRIYSGRYRIDHGILTVASAYGTRTTQLGESPPQVLAQTILREIIERSLKTRR